MKTKFLFIFFTIVITSCSSKKTVNEHESSSPSSRLDKIEAGSNKIFNDID